MRAENSKLVAVLPIHYSDVLTPNLHIHQFPLLARPLQVPPSAVSGHKHIQARIKPNAGRLEVHVPADTRPEVWNAEKAHDLGAARALDDREKNQGLSKGKHKEGEQPKLEDIRLRSEQISHKGVYMLGIVCDGTHRRILIEGQCAELYPGQLHLHPISETHQLRPTLTYLDVLSRKGKRSRIGAESESDSEGAPLLDTDDPAPVSMSLHKKEPKMEAEAKEIQVSSRKTEDRGLMAYPQGGLSSVRREMLLALRNEEEEEWETLEFCDGEVSCFQKCSVRKTSIHKISFASLNTLSILSNPYFHATKINFSV